MCICFLGDICGINAGLFLYRILELLMTKEVSAMFRVKGVTLFELSAKEEYVCYAQLKKYFDQMYFAN